MLESTTVTWVLVCFGVATCAPLLYAQSIMVLSPRSERARTLMIGAGETWRDESHFKTQYALARADWLLFAPVFVASIVGLYLERSWGFYLFGVSGAIQLYINTFLWFFEKEFVYRAQGPLAYYTYFWGNFMYWGTLTLVYSAMRLSGITI